MTVRVYRSTDVSAPVLNGSSGTLISVLDGCLVNGYGSMPSMSWDKPFTGTNLAVYRASIGTRYYLRVGDFFTTQYNVTAFETMTDVNTGTNVFPSIAQQASGLLMTKSITADTVARPWIVIAHERGFFFFASAGGTSTATTNWETATGTFNSFQNLFFGEIYSFAASDPYNSYLMGSISNALPTNMPATSATTGLIQYAARNFSGSVISRTTLKFNPGLSTIACTEFVNLINGQIPMYPSVMVETGDVANTTVTRGRFPAYFSNASLATLPRKRGGIIDGIGAYAGRQYLAVTFENSSSVNIIGYVEITDNWYTP